MNEAGWNTCTEPDKMLAFLRDAGTTSDGKLRLFAAGCCREGWHWLVDERSRQAVAAAEELADERMPLVDAETARRSARAALADLTPRGRIITRRMRAAVDAVRAIQTGEGQWDGLSGGNKRTRCVLLRDIAGNPFRPSAPVGSAWFAWSGGTIRTLARAAYDHREMPGGTLDQARLAVLADSLEEAGAEAELIAHMRNLGPHWRGCHVLDALLGKG